MTEELFEIRGADGLARRGVLTPPAGGVPVTAVLLLPAGLKYRTGPHLVHVRLARRLAAAGHLVLRLDTLGIGESDGSIAPAPIGEVWRTVEEGRFVTDAVLAAQALRSRANVRHVIAGGLCGGALTAQLAAAQRPDLFDGVIAINTAVNFSRVRRGGPSAMGTSKVRHDLSAYLAKLTSTAAWARVLSGQSRFTALPAIVWGLVREILAPTKAAAAAALDENPRFIRSLRQLEQRGTPCLLLFSGNDDRWLEFQDVVLHRYLGGAMAGAHYEVRLVPEANHELHLPAWQDEAWRIIIDWLGRRFPAAAGSPELGRAS
jgi:uncharacterized protein